MYDEDESEQEDVLDGNTREQGQKGRGGILFILLNHFLGGGREAFTRSLVGEDVGILVGMSEGVSAVIWRYGESGGVAFSVVHIYLLYVKLLSMSVSLLIFIKPSISSRRCSER